MYLHQLEMDNLDDNRESERIQRSEILDWFLISRL
jgi:hypothetical protein